MRTLIKFEFSKITNKKNIIFLITIPLLLNFIYLMNTYSYSSEEAKNHKNGIDRLYEEIHGSINYDKFEFINEKYKELSSSSENGRADTNTTFNQKTYTGYLFGDFMLFSQVHTKYVDAINYESKIERKIENLKEAKTLFKDKKEINKINEMIKIYQGREINVFYDYQGVEALLYNNFSTFLCLLALIFIVTQVICNEYESGNYKILFATKIGRTKVMCAKLITIIMLIFVIYTLLSLQDICFFRINNGLNGLLSPVYVLEKLYMTFFSSSILVAYIYTVFVRLLGLLLISLLVTLGAIFIKKSYVLIIGTFFILFVLFSNFELSLLNPVTYLNPAKILEVLDFEFIFGIPTLKYLFAPILLVLMITASIGIYLITYKTNNKKRGKLIWN